MKKLSERLEAIIDMIRPARVLWDIGCDHGLVSISAVSRGKVQRALACDIAEGPLRAASDNIRRAGLQGSITTVLSDGFESLDPSAPADCAVAAGMGGRLIIRILEGAFRKGFDLSKMGQLIIGAQSDLEMLRHFLVDKAGFYISSEVCVYDDGKYYLIMDIDPGAQSDDTYAEADYLLGKHPDPATEKVYKDYLLYLESKYQKAYDAAAASGSTAGTERTGRLLRLIASRKEALLNGR